MPALQLRMHQILGISDEREEEIAKEVITTLTGSGRIDTGTKKLMNRYDAESMLAGMRLMQAINMNAAVYAKQQAERIKQNAALN
jgi:hypothetical protein